MTPEGKVKKDIKEYLDTLEKSACWWYMPVQTGFGKTGIPDFILCVNGRFVAIEVKRGDGKKQRARARQAIVLEDIQFAGGTAKIVTSVEQVKDIIRFELQDYR